MAGNELRLGLKGFGLMILSLMMSCQQLMQRVQGKPVGPHDADQVVMQDVVDKDSAITVSESDLAGSVASLPASKKPSLEQRLLSQAQEAFRKAYYTYPTHNNAFDKFKSVLLINPDNAQARSGLESILLKHTQLVRMALDDGRIRAADNYLAIAERHYPNDPGLKDYRVQVQQQKRMLSIDDVSNLEQANGKKYEELPLPIAELEAKSDVVSEVLSEIAQRLRNTGESILIYARSDSEGRWIYRQLRQSAKGYRIRGDIRVGSSPKVRILPPL